AVFHRRSGTRWEPTSQPPAASSAWTTIRRRAPREECPMLEVVKISKTFADVQAVTDLSFSAKPGAVFGLLGPNGAGKTTTIRMILDIIEPDTGQVRWQGRVVDASVRHTFGYLPEERGLYPKMKVGDQLLFLAQLHGTSAATAKQRIEKLAAALNLTEHLDKAPQELSKGNQQKVQFIAAV